MVLGEVLEGITAQVKTLDADLLIIGTHGTNFVRQLLLGTTAERLLRKTLRPVLTVKQPPRRNYQSVLVPIDFSPWSQSAIQHYCDKARQEAVTASVRLQLMQELRRQTGIHL